MGGRSTGLWQTAAQDKEAPEKEEQDPFTPLASSSLASPSYIYLIHTYIGANPTDNNGAYLGVDKHMIGL